MAQSYINKAIEVLISGGVIAHHTDTVVGFASLPSHALLQRLERIKHRQNKQGFILLASRLEQISHLLSYSTDEEERLKQEQKRPTTWIVNASDIAPALLKSENNQIAVRITNHHNIAPITNMVGPIVSTSANLTHLKTSSTPNEVRKEFGPQIDYIVKSEPNTEQVPSMIIDLHSNKILRS